MALSERDQYIGLVFTGWVDVPVTGTYTFYLMSDDGSRLWIGDQEIVENDGNHAPIMKTGTISLQQGLHPLRLAYYNAGGGRGLAVYMRNPNIGSFRLGERMRIKGD